MKVLFVTPSQVSSGESITALHMAQWLSREGWEVRFFASPFTSSFVSPVFPDGLMRMGANVHENQHTWELLLRDFNPGHIVFADYPLLTLSSGTAPLHDDSWECALLNFNAELFTLDHLGYAQRPRLLFFGPPHGTLGVERIPALPLRMHILLPCPLHDPTTTTLRGRPFQYWSDTGARTVRNPEETRARYLRSADELLVLHLASHWACQAAELLLNPYYRFLPRLLKYYLGSLSRPVTVLSINADCLLAEEASSQIRIVNTGPITPHCYEDILLVSDLLLTENRVSVSMAKAICLVRPCAVFRNSSTILEIMESSPEPVRSIVAEMERERLGSVFPFEVFPIWSRSDLEELGIFNELRLNGSFESLELFGGEATAQAFRALLLDPYTQANMRASQLSYLRNVRLLPTPAGVIEQSASSNAGG